ncbi:MAG: SMC-Scp complex subunit ScpB, partial [Dehalococcoidia bacterium]|nr:SMC-Scp complex subunit ScpB [Dehalococcoidia bacterium]
MSSDATTLEAVLFVASGPTAIARLGSVLGWDTQRVERAVTALAETLATRGIRLQRHGDTIQLVTAPEESTAVSAFLGVDEPVRL